jgi:hypothetical protein
MRMSRARGVEMEYFRTAAGERGGGEGRSECVVHTIYDTNGWRADW